MGTAHPGYFIKNIFNGWNGQTVLGRGRDRSILHCKIGGFLYNCVVLLTKTMILAVKWVKMYKNSM